MKFAQAGNQGAWAQRPRGEDPGQQSPALEEKVVVIPPDACKAPSNGNLTYSAYIPPAPQAFSTLNSFAGKHHTIKLR
jgi:hypothetical protein